MKEIQDEISEVEFIDKPSIISIIAKIPFFLIFLFFGVIGIIGGIIYRNPIMMLYMILAVGFFVPICDLIKTRIYVAEYHENCYFKIENEKFKIKIIDQKCYKTFEVEYSEIEKITRHKKTSTLTSKLTGMIIHLKTGEKIIVPYIKQVAMVVYVLNNQICNYNMASIKQ